MKLTLLDIMLLKAIHAREFGASTLQLARLSRRHNDCNVGQVMALGKELTKLRYNRLLIKEYEIWWRITALGIKELENVTNNSRRR